MIPANVDSVQEPRLSRHNEVILAMLQEGTVTNVDIAKISKNHTARISNLRAAGYDIQCEFINRETGLTKYTLLGRKESRAKRLSKTDRLSDFTCVGKIISEMAGLGYDFSCGPHSGALGYYATFSLEDEVKKCGACENPDLLWEHAGHALNLYDAVVMAVDIAFGNKVTIPSLDQF
jgi:hypothetical protein